MKKILSQNLKSHRLATSNFYDFKRKMDPKNINLWVQEYRFENKNYILETSSNKKKHAKPKKNPKNNSNVVKSDDDASSMKNVLDFKNAIGKKPIPTIPKLGPFEIENPKMEGKTYHWCSCGLSTKQPFCDRSHKGTSFKPINFTLAEKVDKIYLCGCKLSTAAPFCDNLTCCKLKKVDERVLYDKMSLLTTDSHSH